MSACCQLRYVPVSGTGLAQGSRSNGGGNGSITLLKEPVRLQKVSKMLELMGRVVLTALESSLQRSLHLRPADPDAGEGEQPCLQELRACGDFTISSRVDSLGQEGFLADVESGCFGVEVLELHPEPRWGLLLLL